MPWTPASSPVVHELDGEVVILVADQALDRLQVVTALAGDPELVALDLRLDGLRPLVPDQLGDLLRVLLTDAVRHRHGDLGELARQRRLGRVDGLKGDLALDQLLLKDVKDGGHPLVAVRLKLDRVAGPLDPGVDALEVETVGELLRRLVEGVVNLLPVRLVNDVKRGFRSHEPQITPCPRGATPLSTPWLRGEDPLTPPSPG